MNKKKVLFSFADADLEDFDRFAGTARDLGATHVYISRIEKSRWLWERDLLDPYPNWSMLLTSLFKIIRPAEIEAHLPGEFSERNYARVVRKAEIAKQYGLKCAMLLKEPFYLPESVFREHPQWRGPRCDHPRRARNHYFSPCVDHPEILAIYRRAVERLCRDTGVDYFQIVTNDSGGGLCWSTGLYGGANGPEHCRDRSMADRITGFLDVLQEGAKSAGIDLEAEINSNIGYKANEHLMDGVWPHLKPAQSVNGKDRKGRIRTAEVSVNYEYTLNPIRNLSQPFAFLRALEWADRSPSDNLRVVLTPTDFDEYRFLVRGYFRRPTKGPVDRTRLIGDLAKEIVGSREAYRLVEAWSALEEGIEHFRDTTLEGLVSCSVNQRWLNRPFVLFPDELDPQDRSYFRPFLFQANDEAHANDLLDIQNSSFIRGYSGVFMATKVLDRAKEKLALAARLISEVAEATDDADLALRLALNADRVKLLICFLRNAKNAIGFQHVVDTTDYERVPVISPEWPLDAERNLLRFEEITRNEIDNAIEIIRLIEGRESVMLELAPSHELEDVFLFSPRIVEQLEKKTHIMLDHLLDGKRLYETNNS